MIREDREQEDKFRLKLAGHDVDGSGGTSAWQQSLEMNARNRRN